MERRSNQHLHGISGAPQTLKGFLRDNVQFEPATLPDFGSELSGDWLRDCVSWTYVGFRKTPPVNCFSCGVRISPTCGFNGAPRILKYSNTASTAREVSKRRYDFVVVFDDNFGDANNTRR